MVNRPVFRCGQLNVKYDFYSSRLSRLGNDENTNCQNDNAVISLGWPIFSVSVLGFRRFPSCSFVLKLLETQSEISWGDEMPFFFHVSSHSLIQSLLAQLFFIYSKQFGTIEGQERRQRKHDVKTHLEDFQPKATHGRINLLNESEPVHALVGVNTHLYNKFN